MTNSEGLPSFSDREPKPVAEVFADLVEHLHFNNCGFVMAGRWGNMDVSTLHLYPRRQTLSERKNLGTLRAGYHYVYKALDTEAQISQLGIVIANARVQAPSQAPIVSLYDRNETSRHYFTRGNGPIQRHDKFHRRPVFSAVIAGLIDRLGDPDQQRDDPLAREFKNDVLEIAQGTPLVPLTNLTYRHAGLWDVYNP